MARSNSKRGRTVRRSASTRGRRSPVAGRVGPVVDVRSKGQISNALNLIKKGPITLVFIYADWCGHCSTFKPKYLNAVNSPGRTTQAVMVNDSVVSDFNSALSETLRAKPLNVEGYPTTVIMNQNGSIAGEIPPSASEEDISVMATMRTPPSANTATNTATNTSTIETTYTPSPVEELGAMDPTTVTSGNTSLRTSNGNTRPSVNLDTTKPVSPSLVNADVIDSEATPVRRGGGLYGALASAAYSLAPAGILLAGLHAVRGRKRTMKGGKRSKRTRRTVRR